jgi:predicted branched-subunit amino acid permease
MDGWQACTAALDGAVFRLRHARVQENIEPPQGEASRSWPGPLHAFGRGLLASTQSILTYTLFATYLGVGALAHDLNFSPLWAILATVLVWAAPAQMILLTALSGGGTPVQAAAAVSLSAIRLMPMVVALLPMLRTPTTKTWQLILPTHFVAVTVWVASMQQVPHVPRERRIAFVNGLGTGVLALSIVSTQIGYNVAATLPPLFGAAVLFLTPISFLLTSVANSNMLVDRLALGLGVAFLPLTSLLNTGVDMLIAGVAAGSIAYAVHRLRRAA